MIIWHYAVWAGSYYMTLACDINGFTTDFKNQEHGITINRGDVTCPDCKRMMGMPDV